MRNNWLFTRNFTEYKEKYSPFLGQVFDVYDIPSKSLYKAEIVDFVEREKWNSIVCADIETGEMFEINENYVNFNNELWWMYDKAHKDGVSEFEEYYKDYYGIETDCFYDETYYRCTVISIDNNNHYIPKFKCMIHDLNKKVNLFVNDVNYLSVDSEEWKDKHFKSQPDYPVKLEFYKKYRSCKGKTYEVHVGGEVVTGKMIDIIMMKREFMFKLKDGRTVNVSNSDINFTDSKFYLYTKHQLDPLPAYNKIYKDLIGSEVQIYYKYNISNVILNGFETIKRKSYSYYDLEQNRPLYEVKCLLSDTTSNNTLKLDISDVNIDKSSKWTKEREVLIKNHNDKMEQEAKKKKILAEKKKKEEELQIDLSKELEAKKEQYNQLNKNRWEDVIGFEFQCFCAGEIKICTVLSVQKTKKSYVLDCKMNNTRQLLKIQNVNILKEDNWGLDKVELYRNRKESEQKAKKYEAPSREHAEIKNFKLVRSLENMRDEMCGVGTRKVKLMLNKKIKENDKIAELYRVALEVEDCNISAKKYRGTYKSDYYDKKQEKLMELVDLCLIYNDEHDDKVVYGKEFADGYSTNAIVYFELPGCEQISFHTTLSHYEVYEIPNYNKEWDGLENSTMYKLEEAINNRYYKDKNDE